VSARELALTSLHLNRKVMKITTLLAGVALGAAAVPVAQITQEAIIKVSGNIDVRSPISVDAMPPLSFKTIPVETIEIDDTVGFYVVPAGKRRDGRGSGASDRPGLATAARQVSGAW
jgi:hypothetical protein